MTANPPTPAGELRGADVFERIEDGHERLETLLEGLAASLRARTASSRRLRLLLRRVDGILRAQQRAEERYLYRSLDSRHPGVRNALGQHRHLEQLLDELAMLDPRSPRWESGLRCLMWSAELHFRHEEEEVFELARTRGGSEGRA